MDLIRGGSPVFGYDGLELVARRAGVAVVSVNMGIRGAGRPLDKACRFRLAGLRIECATNGVMFYVEVAARSSVILAAGAPDELLLLADKYVGSVGDIQLFARFDGAFPPDDWLNGPDARELLAQTRLQRGEQILCSRDRIAATLHASIGNEIWKRVEALVALAQSLRNFASTRATSGDGLQEALPRAFVELQYLADAWARPDDHERSNAMGQASTPQLQALVRAVTPHFNAINALLEGTREPLPPSLSALSRLAEAASEAQIELARRETEALGLH
jgi:hypothetical protein